MESFKAHCLKFCTAAIEFFTIFSFLISLVQIFIITNNIFIHSKNSFVFILLGKVAHFFVSFSDFGLLPTITVCVIQNGRTPLLLLQLLLLILPADETTVYTVCNLYFYLLSLLANLFLSPVLQAIVMCLTSVIIFDQYSMLFTLIMFNFIDNSM